MGKEHVSYIIQPKTTDGNDTIIRDVSQGNNTYHITFSFTIKSFLKKKTYYILYYIIV